MLENAYTYTLNQDIVQLLQYFLCSLISYCFLGLAKERKQLPVYQWHSVVPYFNIERPKTDVKPAPKQPVPEMKAAKKVVTLPPIRPSAIHQSISDNSMYSRSMYNVGG